MINLILDESKWLSVAILMSIIAVIVLISRQRGQNLPHQLRNLEALNLFFGCMIGIMSFGHLLAVTVKVFQGTLEGSLWILYPLGLALAIPSCWLAVRVGHFVKDVERWSIRMLALNAWLGICLLAFGFHNWPLAVPAALNIAYQFHSRPAVGWAIVAVAVVSVVTLFIGSLVFFASGQSFEQFKGMG